MLSELNFNFWNSDPNTFYTVNLGNFKLIQNFIDEWNSLSEEDDLYELITVTLDVTDYGNANRNAYIQFLENAKKINSFIKKYCDNYVMDDFVATLPDIPYSTNFEKDSINKYWTTLQNDFNHLIKGVQANTMVQDI